MLKKYVPVELVAPAQDFDNLKPGDKTALTKLIQAAKLFDPLYLLQSWSGNLSLYQSLKQRAEAPNASQEDKQRFEYFFINRGPWSVCVVC